MLRTQPTRTRGLLFVFALLATALAGAESLPRATSEEVGMSAQRLQQLTATLRRYVDDGQLAGGVALVARKGRIVHFEPFGQRDRESKSPMHADSIFRIASQTKAIVSAATLMLQEEGKLLIGDSVGKYIPEFKETRVAVAKPDGGYDVVKAKRPVTIRDLLTHTSGLSYGNGPAADQWKAADLTSYYFSDKDETIGASVARMGSLPFDAQPGERWIYGYSTDVLGAVVERASGMPLDQFLSKRIFGPLGMTDTAFYLPKDKRGRLVTVYATPAGGGRIERAPEAGQSGQGAYVDGPRKNFSGGAGLLSTASDYSRFLQMMLNGGELDGQRILSRKTVELMTSNHVGTMRGPSAEGQGFGLGFYTVEDLGARGIPGSLGEFGWGGAYHSTYWADPREQLVVVYLTQLNPAGTIDDFGKLRAIVYNAIVD